MRSLNIPETHVQVVHDALDFRLAELEESSYEAPENDPIHEEIAHLTEVIDQL